jgi:uncharacterized protein (TIGR02145 family)
MKRNLLASIVSIFSMKSIKSLPLVLTVLLLLGFGITSKINAQCIGPYQGFESFGLSGTRTTMITNGWAFSAAGVTPTTSAANARSGTNVLSLGNAAGNAATTPTISNPSEFKFYYRGLSATNTINVTAQWSTDNFSTTGGIATGVANLSYQSITFNNFGGAASVKVRISITGFNGGSAALFVDDLSWTSTNSALNNIIVPELGNLTCNPVNVPAAGTGTYSFYDQGGFSDTYNKSQTQIVHFAPSTLGEKVKITFNSFAIDAFIGTNITVYNGNGTTTGTEFPGLNAATAVTAGTTVTSTDASGYITVKYVTTALAGTLSATTHPGFNTTLECVSAPIITSLTGSGCTGGNLVIAGTNLAGATAVTVGSVAATIVANTATSLTVTPTPGSSGTVTVTTAAGSVTSTATYAANLLPTISSQPSTSTQTICINGVATPLSVTATAGSGAIQKYEWYSNSTASNSGGTLVAANSSAATTDTYTPSTASAVTLYYYVVVTNTNGCSVTSSLSGAITVNTSVTITSNPSTTNQTVCAGSALTLLSVTATGGGLGYQWYSNNTNSNVGGTLISGATAASYTPSNAVAMATTYYYCVVSNGAPCNSSVTSAVSGGITVNALPAAVTVSASGTYCTNTTLTATNGGSGTMYFQSTISGGTFTFAPIASQVISLSGTYYFRARSAAGCWGPEGSATVMILSVPVAPTASAATLLTTNSFTASWNSVSGATGYFLDVATDTGFTSLVSGYSNLSVGNVTTFSVTGLNPATTYYYRVRANNGTCSGPSSNEITATTATITYCTTSYPSGNAAFGDNITNVTLGNLSNNSSTSNPPYIFFNNVTVPNLYQGATATISISFGRETVRQYVGVWIDYNKNGVFENSEGVVSIFDAGVDGTATLTLTIPAGALPGNTRMRVRGGDDNPLTLSMACGFTNSSFGETEDYIVNIINVPSCTVSSPPTGLTSSFVTNTTATLSWSDASFAPSSIYEYALNTTTTRPASGTLITGATSVSVTGLAPNTTYYYWVRTNCGGSNQSAWTGPSSFFTTAAVEVILNNSTTGGSTTTCNGRFYDSGGAAGNYSNNETYTYTFVPSTLGSKLKVVFNSCALQSNSDFLSIYNGTTVTAANLIGNFTGSQIAAGQAFISTAAGGELTFRFTSNGSSVLAGWDASITCVAVPRIDSFTPTSSCSGATPPIVTIIGANFIPGQTTVSFNGVTATPISVSPTAITVNLPVSATTGNISVATPDATGTSATVFNINPLPTAPTAGADTVVCEGVPATLNSSGSTVGSQTIIINNCSSLAGWTSSESGRWNVLPTSLANGSIGGELRFGNFISVSSTVNANILLNQLINTSGYSGLNLTFRSAVDWFSGSGTFNLFAETSTDGVTWSTVWSSSPSADVPSSLISVNLGALDGTSFFIRFRFNGNVNDIEKWTIDDVTLSGSRTPSLSYTWSTSSTLTPVIASTQSTSVTPSSTQTYYVATSVNGCTSGTDQVVVSTTPRPTAVISGTQAVCNGNTANVSIALTGTGPWNLSFTDGTTTTNVTGITSSPYDFFTPLITGARTYTLTSLNDTKCSALAGSMTGSAVITTIAAPTVTLTSTAAEAVCYSNNSQLTTLAYSSISGSPATYSVVWGAGIVPAGFAAMTDVPFQSASSGTISITVPPGADNTVLNTATLIIKNAQGCVSSYPFTLTVNRSPQITITTPPTTICYSTASQIVSYSYTTSNNTSSYDVTWASPSNGLLPILNATAGVNGNINITVPASTPGGTYTGSITPKNAGCGLGVIRTITLIISQPSITPAVSSAPVSITAGAQTTTLVYSNPTATPTLYSISWNATPSNSFSAVTDATLSTSPLTINIPAGTAANTYTGTISVKNANGCVSPGNNFSVVVNNIQITASANTICSGTSVSLTASTSVIQNSLLNSLTFLGQFNGHSYYLTNFTSNPLGQIGTELNPNEMQQMISPYGGYLTSIESSQENTFIANSLPTSLFAVWIGLSDYIQEGNYTWLNGTNANYFSWRSGEPNNQGNEDFTIMYGATSYPGAFSLWNDEPCGEGNGPCNPFYFVIESNSPLNQSTISYLWSTGETTADINPTPTATTTYWCDVTINGVTSRKEITITVNPNILSSVSIQSTSTLICPGVSVTFTAIPTNGGTAPSYQWKVNGVNVGSNSTTFTSTTIANNDVVSVVMTTNESPCLSGSPATSNSITMTVNPILEALVIIGATGTMICSGTSVTFNATPINGGSAPSFQWKINGNNVGVNSPFYTTTTLANNDVVSVVMTSNASPCLTGSPATSNSITITVTPANTVTAASSTPTTCINSALTAITHTTTRATGIGIATGLPAGVTATWATNTITISGTPTTSGTFNYSIPLTGGCGTVNATGTIVINPNLPASVSIGASATTICSGNSVTFNATTTNGGASPSFQWKLNGVNVGTNSAIYTTTTLSNNDVVSLFMTSNANPCLTGSPATSNSITMFVDSIPMATPASNQTFCASATVANLVATGTNIKWYTTATGGTALSSNSALVSGTYYVSQTVNGCESTRLPVSVIITSPTVPTFQQVPSTCSGSSINPLQTTSLNGITGTWSPVLNNTTTTTYTFTPIAGQCATTTNQTITITTPIVTSAISFVAPITTLSKVSNSPVLKSNTTQLRAPGPPPPGLCPSPSNLIAFAITQTTANLSWVDNNYTTNFSWEIEVLPANSSPTGSGIVYVGNLPYSISELTAGTAYKYYVRTNCQYGNYSAWVGPYSFTTLSPPTDVQNLCAKTIQPYNVNVGDTTHNGSTYVWSITPGTPSAIITGNGTNAITIDWSNVPSGTYTIQTIETSIGGCVSIPVTAIINLTPTAIPVAQSQTFCASATVANLVATGTKIQWYASATGGTALSATTALVSGTYYLSQIVNGCESSRLPVSIVVTSPIVPAFQLIPSTCIGSSINPLPTTSLNGITGTWSPVLNNTTTTTYTFTPTAGQCATTTTQTITIITPKVTSQISFTDTITTLSKVNNKGTILKSNTIQLRIPPIPPPGCSAPDNLTANNVTQTTANLSWVDSNYSTTGFWEIEVISSGSLPTGLGAEYIGTLPYPITGLTAGTVYKYYVRARCFNSLYPNYAFYSDWVGPYSFTTSPPPTPTQNLCTQNIQPYNVNVGDATHNGSNYVWSISPSTSSVIITGNGTNAITIDWANVPSGTYTLQAIETSIDGCVSIPVTAIINLTPTAIPVAQSQTFCTSATVANLVATGSNIQWYSAATGSSALTTTTALVSGTYFVSQTNNGCESYRLPVSIVVSSPTVPTFQQIASTCTGSSINPLPTTSNNGITGTWSPALNNTTTTTYTFTPTAGQCATTTTQTITITTPKVTSQISFGIPDNIVSLPSVAIGTQVWTNKNLDVTTYRDGTPIPQVINAFALQNLTTGAWCYVNNDRANGAIYGKLYNWYAVAGIYDTASLNSATLRKQLAPVGWHVPTYEEWNTVITFLGGINVAGGKMKSTGTTLWLSPNTDATNESGFTGLPGDGYYSSGSFGGWWSSSEYSARGAWSIGLEYNSGFATIDDNYKDPGLSVRFIRDLSLTSSSTQTLCVKSVQPYNVNIGDSSHNGSTYVWSISPSTQSAIITGNGTNAITIDWSNVPSGTYTLQAIETSFDGCISLPVTAIINLTPTALPIAQSQTFCNSATVANLVATGTNIQWYTSSTGGSALTTTTSLVTSTYYVSQTVNGCESERTSVPVTINPNLAASVSIGASTTIICSGTSISFTATPVNGGTSPSYQWQVNGVNVGTNNATYTTTTLSNNDLVSVIMTSNASPCLIGSPATSNSITMTVNPILEVLVFIGATGTTICSGTSVSFNATPINGGSAPTYQWKLNGNNVGVNSPFYTTTTLSNNDVVSLIMTSNASPCLTGSPATSNSITITVTPANTVTAASSTPTTCINTALSTITHTTTRATGIGIATGLPAGVTATWSTNIITISGTPTASGTFNYSIPLTGGCGTINATGTIVIHSNLTACESVVTVKMNIQGFTLPNGMMRPVLANQGVGSSSTDVDNVTIELHNTSVPFATFATTTAMLQTNGDAVATFSSAPVGSFYIVVRHRNSLETWSANPVTIGASSTYDFTDSASKAYGNNMILVGSKYSIYNGDLNQDGFVESGDYPSLYNDSDAGQEGYYSTDLNGDGFVESGDYPILFNNSDSGIEISRP